MSDFFFFFSTVSGESPDPSLPVSPLYPLSINIRRANSVIELNKLPFQLAQLPFVRSIPQLRTNDMFETVTEDYLLRLNVSQEVDPVASAENNLLALVNILNGVNESLKSPSYPVLLEVVPTQSGIDLDTYGFAARIISSEILLPDTDIMYPYIKGITELTIRLERGPFYNRRMYGFREIQGGAYQNLVDTPFVRIPARNTITQPYTVNSYQRSLMHSVFTISGTLPGQTPTYLITSNHPALQLYDLQSVSDSVSSPNASGGSLLQTSLVSPITANPIESNTSLYVAECTEIALYGSIRTEGSIRVRSRLVGARTSDYTEWVYPNSYVVSSGAVPVFDYLGTLSLKPGYSTNPSNNLSTIRFSVELIAGISGLFQIDTLAIVPVDSNSRTHIVLLEPGSDYANCHFGIYNPALGAYNGTKLLWNQCVPSIVRSATTPLSATPQAIIGEMGEGSTFPVQFDRAAIGDLDQRYTVYTRFGEVLNTDYSVRSMVLATLPVSSGWVTNASMRMRPVFVEEYPYLRGIVEQPA